MTEIIVDSQDTSGFSEDNALIPSSTKPAEIKKSFPRLYISILFLLFVAIEALRYDATRAEPMRIESQELISKPEADPVLNLSLIFEQKRKWCLEFPSWEGYIMHDSTGCWALGREIVVSDERYHDKNHTESIITMDIQKMLANKTILILGDSLSRYALNAFISVINGEEPTFNWFKTAFHGKITRVVGLNTTVHWEWRPLVSEILKVVDTQEGKEMLKNADHTLVMLGLHDVIFRYAHNEMNAKALGKKLRTVFGPLSKDLTYQTAAPISLSQLGHGDTEARDAYTKGYPHVTPKNILNFNLMVADELTNPNREGSPIRVLDGFWRFQTHDSDGMHSTIHALHTSYRFLWRIFWEKDSYHSQK